MVREKKNQWEAVEQEDSVTPLLLLEVETNSLSEMCVGGAERRWRGQRRSRTNSWCEKHVSSKVKVTYARVKNC